MQQSKTRTTSSTMAATVSLLRRRLRQALCEGDWEDSWLML
jgi:hypothetical protein